MVVPLLEERGEKEQLHRMKRRTNSGEANELEHQEPEAAEEWSRARKSQDIQGQSLVTGDPE
jgi:hypothetical protein